MRAVAGGHEVEIVDGDPAEAEKLAGELCDSAAALEPGTAFGGEIVVFAVYYPGSRKPCPTMGSRLSRVEVVFEVASQSYPLDERAATLMAENLRVKAAHEPRAEGAA